ncbi:hypothetical protein CH373_04685 [Leptospira perolatii]|uniref:Ligase n=1 Tax=Leptospira perolatii TaxID=2023191 RepID=A0A2M9ZQ61_9LEPT|nr:hypothetical protein [Leptospira perolatii]PJZ68321.1 hypothetical protein CH360_16910 [Leptospira perolatii]PJZ74212.1 hypothetical protein CH373_04685 [Leptospira perolatii]
MINRKALKELPWKDSLFLLGGAYFLFLIYRFVYPLNKNFLLPGFLIQFFLAFVPQIMGRRWGRIFTAFGTLTLVRISWLGFPGLQVHYTGLAGLFLGAILGIWVREWLLAILNVSLPLKDSKVALSVPRKLIAIWSQRNPKGETPVPIWGEAPFWILIFILFLLVERFFRAFGFSIFYGLGIQEFLFFPGVSSREYLSGPVVLAVNLGFPILYLFSEERCSSDSKKISLDLLYGTLIGFLINVVVMVVQFFYRIDFLAFGSNLSVSAGRVSGLLLDSGSASWILPLVTVFILGNFWENKKNLRIQKVSFFFVLLPLSLVSVSFLGMKLGKTFWVIWILFFVYFGTYFLYKMGRWKSEGVPKFQIGIPIYLLGGTVFFLLIACVLIFFLSQSFLSFLVNRFTWWISLLGSGEIEKVFLSIDEVRTLLSKVTIENFASSPWIGQGWGSFLFTLKDPSRLGTKIPNGFVDSPPVFYLGILQDLGILGTFLFLVLICFVVWKRQSLYSICLLAIPFLFGQQVQHADGAWIAVFLLLYPPLVYSKQNTRFVARVETRIRWKVILAVFLLLVSFAYQYISIRQSATQGIGAEFRKKEIGMFQLGAAMTSKVRPDKNHLFVGKVWEWRISPENFLKPNLILRFQSSDLKNKDTFSVFLLDKNREVLLEQHAVGVKPGEYAVEFENLPKESVNLQLSSERKASFLLSEDFFDPAHQLRLVRR